MRVGASGDWPILQVSTLSGSRSALPCFSNVVIDQRLVPRLRSKVAWGAQLLHRGGLRALMDDGLGFVISFSPPHPSESCLRRIERRDSGF
ncbi:hypothetical protein GW17_00034723 [Ensete ventricosum]|nr:hypothetical protein GW17_00034723 [Ensete ventricosum]